MQDETKGRRRPDNKPGDPASAGSGENRATARERDFGDSAGYGGGGSTLDFHDAGDDDADPVKGKHNPLDGVMNKGDGSF